MTRRMSLAEAVGRHVEPGMHLHFASTPSRSNASVFQVARAFLDKDPRFTLSATGFHSSAHLFGLLRLGRKFISCFFGDNYPTPRPNALYGALEREGVEMEAWSLLSYVTALRAGALGVSHETTPSLVGTSLGADLTARGRFRELDINGKGDERIGLVAAMRPDVAFLHAAAGDEHGNFIASPPYSEGFWGAMAAKRGVIVTVERWADADLVRRYVDWIKVPAYRVLAICEEPFGAHPQPSYFAANDDLVPQYLDDFAHYELWRRMTSDRKAFDEFVEQVLRAPDTSRAYRAFVGKKRLDELRASAKRVREERRAPSMQTKRVSGTKIRAALPLASSQAKDAMSSADRLTVLAARAIVRRVKACGYESILAGIGSSFAAARLAKLELEEVGVHVEVMVETGLIDLDCGSAAESFLLAYPNIAHAARLSSIDDVLGTLTCGAGNRCLGVLGSAEVDVHGNINTSRLASGEFLVGSGGANDIAGSCAEVVVVAKCSPARLVAKVHYVTSSGRNVRTIVTEQAVLARETEMDGWSFAEILPSSSTRADVVAHVRARSGFPISETASSSALSREPTRRELEGLAMIRGSQKAASVTSRAGGE